MEPRRHAPGVALPDDVLVRVERGHEIERLARHRPERQLHLDRAVAKALEEDEEKNIIDDDPEPKAGLDELCVPADMTAAEATSNNINDPNRSDAPNRQGFASGEP